MLASKLASPAIEPELMVWDYTEPAIILGCSQRRHQPQWQALQRKRDSALSVVCRRAGGGVVLAGPWMLSATLFVPVSHVLSCLSLPASFELFGRAWSKTLMQGGIDSELAQREDFAAFNQRAKRAGLDWICFAGLSHGELLDTDGRKLMGLAQIRKKQGLAVVSGLLLQTPPWYGLLSGHPQEAEEVTLQASNTVLQQLMGSVAVTGGLVERESLGRLLQEILNAEINLLSGSVLHSVPI